MNKRLAFLCAIVVLGIGVSVAWYGGLGADLWPAQDADPPADGAANGSIADADLPLPPVPPRIADGDDYDQCLGMLNDDPDGANAFAEAWQAKGGRDGAAHCLALAQIALGDPETGAQGLEKIAHDSTAPPLARAQVYDQAVQAWFMVDEQAHAYAAASAAIALSPDDSDLLVDRAMAAMGMQHYQDAIDDLTKALGIEPKRADALTLRASAWRQQEKLDRAEDDIDRALAIDPDNPESLLERGILRQRHGDRDGAKADWERAITLAPDTDTADLAQQNLALLEAGPHY